MAESPPDRLSVNPKSPFYDEAVLARPLDVRFNGRERNDVEEYCMSEGWVRVAAGRAVDRRGNPLTLKHNGRVEVSFKDETGSSDSPVEGKNGI
ncbi:MAG: DUF3297 family protein [Gammaproteobacteria bacterium]